MSRGVDYTPDRKGMARVMQSREVRDITRKAAERGADWIRANAPVESGDYRDSIGTDSFTYRVFGADRACASVSADVPYALDVDLRHNLFPRAVDVIESSR